MYTESQKTTYAVNNKDIRSFLGYPEDYPLHKIVEDLIPYLRKSRKDEELYGNEAVEETLARHTKTIQEWAISIFGVPFPEENLMKEVVSGESIEGRPVMQNVLKMVEGPRYRGIVCVDVQRLGRGDLEDQGRMIKVLQFSNTKVLTPNQWFDLSNKFDKKFFEQKMRESKEYLDYIKEIMGNGRMRSVLDGSYPHSIAPYGFNRIHIEGAKGYTLEYNQEEYKVCKLAVNLIENGLHIQYTVQEDDTITSIAKTFGITKRMLSDCNINADFKVGDTINIDADYPGTGIIANYLNFLGIKPRSKERWTPYMVRSFLVSLAAHGFVSWGRRKTLITLNNGNFLKSRPLNNQDAIIVKGRHPAIYTERESKIIKEHLERSKKPIRNDKIIKNPLVGLIKCELCGCNMQRRPYSQRQRKYKFRAYSIDRTKLRLLLREHKGELSLNDIARSLHVSKHIIDNWFSASDKHFTIPYATKWFELKKLLNIETTEFDEALTTYYESEEPHIDILLCGTKGCNNVASDLNLIEKRVIESLQIILKDYKDYIKDYANKVKEEIQTNESALEMLNKKIEEQKQKLDKLCDLLESGIYSEQLFSERKFKIDTEIINLERKRKQLSSNNNIKKFEEVQKMIPQIEEVLYNYDEDMTPEMKNNLLSSIIKVIYYKKELGGRKYKDNFKLKIYLKI